MTVSNTIGVFEADANAGKLSAEAAANSGFELEKAIDRAIFRAKERFGSYLAGAQSKEDLESRWTEVKPKVIQVIAEITTPTSSVIQRVGKALDPALSSRAAARRSRPTSTKTAGTEAERRELAYANRGEVVPGSGRAIEPKDFTRVGATQKHAWAYDQTTKLYTSKDPMQKFACPGCGTEQEQLGFTHCAGCERTWNSWPVRRQGTDKTSASTYVLMAREIKMRSDKFKLAATGNVKLAESEEDKKAKETAEDEAMSESQRVNQGSRPGPKSPGIPSKGGAMDEPPMPTSPPNAGTMPGDNSGATGAPMPAEQPPTPGAGDQDVAGGVTEGSPIDQIQDALQDAIVALKDVQMLSVNPQLSAMASVKGQKVAKLRDSMDRFWGLHKQMNYVAEMLASEANAAIKSADPRITSEAEFVQGFQAAAANEPLPAKVGKVWLEGYVAFHKQAETYSDGANIGGLFKATPDGESPGAHDDGTWTDGGAAEANDVRGDSGLFGGQPAAADFASQMDEDNRQNKTNDQGQSGTLQPTGARRALPKGKR